MKKFIFTCCKSFRVKHNLMHLIGKKKQIKVKKMKIFKKKKNKIYFLVAKIAPKLGPNLQNPNTLVIN